MSPLCFLVRFMSHLLSISKLPSETWWGVGGWGVGGWGVGRGGRVGGWVGWGGGWGGGGGGVGGVGGGRGFQQKQQLCNDNEKMCILYGFPCEMDFFPPRVSKSHPSHLWRWFGDRWWEIHLAWETIQNAFSCTLSPSRWINQAK